MVCLASLTPFENSANLFHIHLPSTFFVSFRSCLFASLVLRILATFHAPTHLSADPLPLRGRISFSSSTNMSVRLARRSESLFDLTEHRERTPLSPDDVGVIVDGHGRWVHQQQWLSQPFHQDDKHRALEPGSGKLQSQTSYEVSPPVWNLAVD